MGLVPKIYGATKLFGTLRLASHAIFTSLTDKMAKYAQILGKFGRGIRSIVESNFIGMTYSSYR